MVVSGRATGRMFWARFLEFVWVMPYSAVTVFAGVWLELPWRAAVIGVLAGVVPTVNMISMARRDEVLRLRAELNVLRRTSQAAEDSSSTR